MVSKDLKSKDYEDLPVLKLRKSDMLFREGDRSQSVFLIKSGRVRVYRTDKKRGNVELAQMGENQIVGEMAFLDGRARSANVQAIVATEVIELDTKKFSNYLKTQPGWLRIVIESLLTKLRATNEKL